MVLIKVIEPQVLGLNIGAKNILLSALKNSEIIEIQDPISSRVICFPVRVSLLEPESTFLFELSLLRSA